MVFPIVATPDHELIYLLSAPLKDPALQTMTTIKRIPTALIILVLTFSLIQCTQKPEPGTEEHIKQATSMIDDAYLVNADNTPENWVTYGKNYAEDRFSSLAQINKENVGKLGLAWALNLETTRGIEATPLVVDGIIVPLWSME